MKQRLLAMKHRLLGVKHRLLPMKPRLLAAQDRLLAVKHRQLYCLKWNITLASVENSPVFVQFRVRDSTLLESVYNF